MRRPRPILFRNAQEMRSCRNTESRFHKMGAKIPFPSPAFLPRKSRRMGQGPSYRLTGRPAYFSRSRAFTVRWSSPSRRAVSWQVPHWRWTRLQ